MMPIPNIENIPKIETIEDYYKRNGLVFNQKKFDEATKQDSIDAETSFYNQMGFYAQ